MRKKICMIVQNPLVKGGIAAVVNGYRGSQLEEDFNIIYVESYKDGGKFAKFLKAILGYIHFIKVLLVDRPDIVHIHSSFGASFYRKLPFIYIGNIANKPIINHIHGSEFEKFYTKASKLKKYLIRKAWNKCSAFIVLSEHWKETLSVVVPKEKIHIIENYSNISPVISNTECKNQILFLGAINKMKGCYDIPSVAKIVTNKISNCKFIIGGYGDIETVKKIAKKLNVEEFLIFPGWVSGELKDTLLKDSDIFFLPSYTEGMPMAILDAMGYGMPIVSTDVGSIPKIVHNKKNGYICEPGDIEGFSKAIIEIINNKEKMKYYGKYSYKIAKEKYSLESHIQLLKNLYLEFII